MWVITIEGLSLLMAYHYACLIVHFFFFQTILPILSSKLFLNFKGHGIINGLGRVPCTGILCSLLRFRHENIGACLTFKLAYRSKNSVSIKCSNMSPYDSVLGAELVSHGN